MLVKFPNNKRKNSIARVWLKKGQGKIASNGALAINTGKFTGRAPKDRFIVKDKITKERTAAMEGMFGPIRRS